MGESIKRLDEHGYSNWLLFDLLPVSLPSDTGWLWAENEYEGYAGFDAYIQGEHLFMGAFGAYLAEFDPDEPDIEELEEDNVPGVDAFLKREISKQMEITQWMASQLNIKPWGKGLATAYIAIDEHGRQIQHVAMRARLKGTRFILQSSFDVEHKDRTSGPFMQILGSVLAACQID